MNLHSLTGTLVCKYGCSHRKLRIDILIYIKNDVSIYVCLCVYVRVYMCGVTDRKLNIS